MNKIQKKRLERQRLGQIMNEKIVPGDLYEMSWRKERGNVIVMATYGIPKSDKHFCGIVIKVPDDSDFPVGAHMTDLLVANAAWVHPRREIILKNN